MDQDKTETEVTDDENVTEDEDIEEIEEEPETGIYEIRTTMIPEKGGIIEAVDEIAEGEDLEFTVTVNEGYLPEYVEVDGESIDPVDFDEDEYTFFFNVENIISETGVIEIEAGFVSMADANLNMSLLAEPIETRDIDSSKIADTFTLMPGGQKYELEGESSYIEGQWGLIHYVDEDGYHYWSILDDSGNVLTGSDITGININLNSGQGDRNKTRIVSIAEDADDLIGKTIYIRHDFRRGEAGWPGELGEPDYELFEIKIVEQSATAYFYVKKDQNVGASNIPQNYRYWGKGSIPMGLAENYDFTQYDHVEVPSDWDLEIPEPDKTTGYDGYDESGYPILESQDDKYYWEDSPSRPEDSYYYTIEWLTLTLAEGAAGPDFKNIVDGTQWHIDGDVTLYNDNYVFIKPHVQNVDKKDNEDFILAPNNDNLSQNYPIEKSVNIGQKVLSELEKIKKEETLKKHIEEAEAEGYQFGWYFDENGENPVTLEDISDHLTTGTIEVYGIYKNTEVSYTIEYHYDGVAGSTPAEATEAGTFTGTLGEEITVTAPETTDIGENHYILETENLTFTIAESENDFVIDYVSDNKGGGTDYDEPDGTPDKYQKTIIFKVENGSWKDGTTEDKTVVVTLMKDGEPSADGTAATEGLVPEAGEPAEGHTASGWNPAIPSEFSGTGDAEYTYVFAAKSDIEYTIEYRYDGTVGEAPAGATAAGTSTGTFGEEITVTAPETTDIGENHYILETENLTFTIAESGNNFVIDYVSDNNGDGTPDDEQKLTVVFDGGEHGTFNEGVTTSYDLVHGAAYPTAPSADALTIDSGYVLTGWATAEGEAYPTGTVTIEANAGPETVTYVAQYSDDKNNNGQPDDTEPATASITPYNTHIYVGGTNDYGEAGLPNLELELTAVEVNRPVEEENVQSIFINGVAQPVGNGKTIDTYLRAVYVDDDGNVITDDAQHDAVSTTGTYNIEVALTSDVVTANEEAGIETAAAGDETDSGYLMGADERPVLARQSTVLINNNKINFGSSKEDAAQLVVRSVSDTEAARKGEIYRTIYTEEGTIAEGRAIAVIDPSTTFYTNDIEDGRVIDNPSGIRLMVDDVLAPTENDGAEREKLLKEKANAALPELNGMTAEKAEAAGYHYVLRYMDLVDSNNGNAWVSSSTGTDVYVPYQTSDGSETEYRIIHFKDLHREYGLTGQDVVDAINQGAVEVMDIENTPYGIKFHTDAAGFSPFAIIWNENGNFDGTSDDEQDGNTGTGIGSAGGRNESDRNSIGGTYYTVGVNGNWRHMDNVDVNAPLDEAVPAGATAMAAPEWHRWKFFRNDGSNIRSQWAHIANPYAVDDQPKTGWFYFDAEGLMQYGWFLDTATGKWYYLHAESDGMLGTMMTGWHYDLNDGRWYYLDTVTGEMLLGWQNIGGKWYYFNTAPNEQTWNLDSVAGLWRFNNSTARPLGSMYINETTPDGYQVDGSGAWIQ